MLQRPTRWAMSREDLRQVNRSAVFNAIHRQGPISRIDLARVLTLSRAAVTGITSDLIAGGLVYEAEQGVNSGAGRKPILLRVDYDYAFVFGVKVSDRAVTTTLTNLRAEVRAWRADPLEAHDVDTVIATIERAVTALRAEHHLPFDRVVGLGVNLPGIVDTVRGRIRASPLLGWHDVPIAELLEARLAVPALAENDVNALATAAAWFGPGKDHSDFLILTLGRGVGLGIVLNGSVYRGPRGGAGEFGHTILGAPGQAGPQQAGTVEAFLADDALLERARREVPALPAGASPDDLARLADGGDADALALYGRAGEALGLALANLVNIFAPTLVILSGEGMRAAPHLLDAATRTLHQASFCDLARQVDLVVDAWGDEAWAQGAAGLAASRFLSETAPFLGGDPQAQPASPRPSHA